MGWNVPSITMSKFTLRNLKMSRIAIFTSTYPYGKGETFLADELTVLASQAEEILLIPLSIPKDGQPRPIPSNCTVLELPFQHYSRTALPFSTKWKLFKWWMAEARAKHLKWGDFKKDLSALFRTAFKGQLALSSSEITKDTICYTYWFDEWTLALTIGRVKTISRKFITRAHGFDLYEYRKELGVIPYRKRCLMELDQVYSVSHEGRDYLKQKYPTFESKFTTAHLGVDVQHVPFVPSTETPVRIVSCSRMVPLKRLHLIIEALKGTTKAIEWVHFGSGELEEQLKEQASTLPSNVTVRWKGHVSTREIIAYYQTTPIDWLINVSSTEGLPVSIMEAIACGIPVIATNVGGVKEIVTSVTGKLIDADVDVNFLTEQINEAKRETKSFQAKEIRTFYETYFRATKNFELFYASLNS